MKIGMPYQGEYVGDQFGRSSQFIIIEAENGAITGRKIITCEDHENLASILQAEGVDTIITNLISRPMYEMLYFQGMEIITGASGEVEKVARNFLKGELETGPSCRGGR